MTARRSSRAPGARRAALVLLAGLATGAASACRSVPGTTSEPGAAADPGLRGTTWALAAFEAPGQPPREPVGRIWLAFDPDRDEVTGETGCNRLRADYTLDDGAFELSPIDTSRMVCTGVQRMADERDALIALDTSHALEREGDALWIDGAGGWRLRFQRADEGFASEAEAVATGSPAP